MKQNKKIIAFRCNFGYYSDYDVNIFHWKGMVIL